MAYNKAETFDDDVTQGLIKNYKESLALLGEDPEREGHRRPEREVPSRGLAIVFGG